MSLFEIISEEWQKLTWLGRVIWFPIFVPILIFGYAVLICTIPIAFLIEKTIGNIIEFIFHKITKLIYKKENDYQLKE